jgi:hypothetical protein
MEHGGYVERNCTRRSDTSSTTVRPIKAHPDLPDRPTELRVWREGLGFDGQKCVPKGVISAPRYGLRRLCNRLQADS